MKRAIVIVLDSFGVGSMPDAMEYGDDAPDTLGNIYRSCNGLNVPNMYKLGLSHIDGISIPECSVNPCANYGKLEELSKGKDTVTGHWELMGIVSEKGFKIYQNGFPDSFINAVEEAWGRKTIGNIAASGTEIINRLGEQHIKTGYPIVYTSADSVFQIAAHEDIIMPSKLYDLCKTVRRLADEKEMGIGRIIARPFAGNSFEGFFRTERRRDFGVEPPKKTTLDRLTDRGLRTLAIGKIEDIFAGHGIALKDHTTNNTDGINQTIYHMKANDSDFIFTNLVDFDMLFGHRRDAKGYADALEYFDSRLSEILDIMTDDDLLIITADHGCDPTAQGSDHTREYVPVLIKYGKENKSKNLGIIHGFDYVGTLVEKWLE